MGMYHDASDVGQATTLGLSGRFIVCYEFKSLKFYGLFPLLLSSLSHCVTRMLKINVYLSPLRCRVTCVSGIMGETEMFILSCVHVCFSPVKLN